MMTNDVELAAETESDCWRRALAEKVATIVRLRSMTRPDAECDRDRSPAGSRARPIASQHRNLLFGRRAGLPGAPWEDRSPRRKPS
jgi:hypothetical protein